MCGVSGVLVLRGGAAAVPDLRVDVGRMLGCISHRGPDDSGIWSDEGGGVVLGHRRLAIVDLSPAGHQPMHLKNLGSIVFNGEIYNFREIRTELERCGHHFSSGSDTEVILHSVQQWGIVAAVRRFVGMFAFALWDSRAAVLHLARDRFGEKPLFVRVCNGAVWFASEVKALGVVGSQAPDLSSRAARAFLSQGYVPGPLTLLDDAYRVPASSVLSVSVDATPSIDCESLSGRSTLGPGVSLQQYWQDDPPDVAESSESDESAMDQLDNCLRRSIRDQLQCDVPVGVFLSSGVDSSIVAAIAQAISQRPVSTYTVQFDSAGYDESGQAAEIARHIGATNTRIELSNRRLLDEIPTLASDMDEPTGNASYFPLLLMSIEARKHVKVILTGDAGDELFAGYNRYRGTQALWRMTSWMPYFARELLGRGASTRAVRRILTNGVSLGRVGVSRQAQSSAILKLAGVLESRTIGDAYSTLLHCWRGASILGVAPQDVLPMVQATPRNFIRSVTRYDRTHYMQDDNLAKSDRATMRASIEARVPMLDHRLVEFAATLPDRMKVRNGRSKWLLRQLAARYVPREIIDAPKMGFTVPVGAWLRGPLREWASDTVRSADLDFVGITRSCLVDAIREYYEGNRVTDWQFWTLTMLSAWVNQHRATEG